MDGSTLEARWVVDSETGRRYLVDLKTGKFICDENYQEVRNDN